MRMIKMMAGAGLLCCAAGALAQGGADDWRPVDAALLDEQRGGFDLGGGLVVSLGIERMVVINGNLVSSGGFELADLSRLSPEQAGRASAALSALNLVQNGPGNTFQAALPQALGGTVIQNSLNDQVLATRTVINASVNSLDLFKAINFQDSLRGALNNAVGMR